MQLLPEESRFPCDAQHLVVVRKIKDFTGTLPESERTEAAKSLRQPWVWAFVSRRQFPIYVLQTGEQGRIAHSYALGQTPWFRFFISCVLVHEHSHIAFQIGEAAAYRKELDCINQFKATKMIPAQFPTADLERAINVQERFQPQVLKSSDEQRNQPPTRSDTLQSN